MKPWAKQTGFTIVELLIVIVVVAVLAAITIVAFNGIQRRTAETAIKSDLRNAASVLANDNVIAGSFPSSLVNANGGKGVSASQGNSFAYSYYSGSNQYCLSGVSSKVPGGFRVTQAGKVEAGVCAGHVRQSTGRYE